MRVRVKICCISSLEEAKLAIEAGASALGLVSRMPSGPGVIPDELIRAIAKSIPPAIGTFMLTSEISAASIIEHSKRTVTNTIQIVDNLVEGSYNDIRKAIPFVKIVQVVHVIDEGSVDQAIELSHQVDALLLDSGNPHLPVKELGGTGRIHNWKLSRQITDQSPVPVFLAGGLNAENVRQAIDVVRPFGVDVCSGVRTQGKLDPYKLDMFFKMVCG
jgi:phosphoribosylanthranilate isomerase